MGPIIGIGETSNLYVAIIPVVLILISGYTTGSLISKIRRKTDPELLTDFIYGSVALNILFISGFVIFGVLTSAANEYFTAFTFILVGLSALGAFLFFQKLIVSFLQGVGFVYVTEKLRNFQALTDTQNKVFIALGIALLIVLLAYQAAIIYFHPIYNEYDFIFRFLPMSKSILLGNGLNHDFYLGSDVGIRFPPFIQAMNAWLLHSFDYSSIRIFPFYYVILTSILVFSITRTVLAKTSTNADAKYFGLMASAVFLITPAILVMSSRFALQQDIGFIFLLTATFYFLSRIVRADRPARTDLLMLSSSLGLMILTREIGLVISVAIFFLVPAVKYTQGNLKLRFAFTVLSFIPLYVLSIKDSIEFGLTYTTTFRSLTLLVANCAIFYLVSTIKNQNKISSLASPVNIKYLGPLVIPLVFILMNLVIFSGPYPNFTFSGKISESIPLYRVISGESNPITLDLFEAVRNLPRLDVLFISLSVGSTFLFLKLVGIGKMILHLKTNYLYSLILVLFIILLVTWSFLLQSGFQTSDIRHIAYFIPLFSIILIIGIKWGNGSAFYAKIFCYGLIALATAYFLYYNLYTWNYQDHFGGFWIEPNLGAVMSFADFRFAAVAIGILVFLVLVGQRFSKSLNRIQSSRVSAGILIVLLVAQVFVLMNSRIMLGPLEQLDAEPPSNWESNIFQIIDYLNHADDGNVLSVRAPSISFFTNRTNFDLFNPHTFSYAFAPLLSINNSTVLKNKFSDMGIKYLVIPNEKNPQYHLVRSLMNNSELLKLVNSDNDFVRTNFDGFSLYRFDPGLMKLDLLDAGFNWKAANVTVSKGIDNLQITLITNQTKATDSYAYLTTKSNMSQTPVLLSITYASKSLLGNAAFKMEIHDLDAKKRVYSSMLNNTSGEFTNQTFVLPKNIVLTKDLEFRFYILTNDPGEHMLNFKSITLA